MSSLASDIMRLLVLQGNTEQAEALIETASMTDLMEAMAMAVEQRLGSILCHIAKRCDLPTQKLVTKALIDSNNVEMLADIVPALDLMAERCCFLAMAVEENNLECTNILLPGSDADAAHGHLFNLVCHQGWIEMARLMVQHIKKDETKMTGLGHACHSVHPQLVQELLNTFSYSEQDLSYLLKRAVRIGPDSCIIDMLCHELCEKHNDDAIFWVLDELTQSDGLKWRLQQICDARLQKKQLKGAVGEGTLGRTRERKL